MSKQGKSLWIRAKERHENSIEGRYMIAWRNLTDSAKRAKVAALREEDRAGEVCGCCGRLPGDCWKEQGR